MIDLGRGVPRRGAIVFVARPCAILGHHDTGAERRIADVPDDRDRVRARWAEATRQRGQFQADYRLNAQDGRTVWIHDEAVLVFDEQGEPKYWHGFMLDITREKEAEAQLRQSEAEFRLLFSKALFPA